MKVTVDLVIFTIQSEKLKVLLVKRGIPPFKGQFALPGGFVHEGESLEDAALTQVDILELYRLLSRDFKICSTELLNMWGDKKAYSLAQGQ